MIDDIYQKKYDEFEIGDTASITKTVTEADVILFAGITGDFNPLHVNEEFAKNTQFGKRLVHGCFSSGLISAVIGMKLPGPGALYGGQAVKFVKPVFIGDTLTAKATVIEKFTKKDGELKFLKLQTDVYNQDDVKVTEGEATVIVMN
ncbi:MAG TPA: MaoC family dehydratase [Candidatus Lokiarchaeia archaeon]|nr:MaoC family dehydratase [Candidatus Lokiarchaeia archaeon]